MIKKSARGRPRGGALQMTAKQRGNAAKSRPNTTINFDRMAASLGQIESAPPAAVSSWSGGTSNSSGPSSSTEYPGLPRPPAPAQADVPEVNDAGPLNANGRKGKRGGKGTPLFRIGL